MKIITKRITNTVIEATTQELLNNFRASVNDMIHDFRPRDLEKDPYEGIKEVQRQMSLLSEVTIDLLFFRRDAIQGHFKEGLTMMLLGEGFSALDKADKRPVSLKLTNELGQVMIIQSTEMDY
jgi:hypothetical protein